MIKRLCTGCNQEKPLDSDHFTKDKYDPTGFTYRCKICRGKAHKEWCLKNPEKVKEINHLNRDKRKQFYKSPEGIISSRRAHLKRVFGISLEEYNIMSEKQNHICAICGKPEMNNKNKVLCVDHNHKTGAVRQLLCGLCNSGLGAFRDDKTLLTKAIKYLKYHESNLAS